MRSYLVILGLLLILFSTELHHILAPIVSPLHQACVEGVSLRSDESPYSLALICGKNFAASSRILWTHWGAIHLLVVSGFHFNLLNMLLQTLNCHAYIRLFILLGFWLFTNMAPAATRAVVDLGVAALSDQYKLYWTPSVRWLLTLCICLSFNPKWLVSLGLELSATATLFLIAFSRWPIWLMIALPLVSWIALPDQFLSPNFLAVLFMPLFTYPILFLGFPLSFFRGFGLPVGEWEQSFWSALESIMFHTLDAASPLHLEKSMAAPRGFRLFMLLSLWCWVRSRERQRL